MSMLGQDSARCLTGNFAPAKKALAAVRPVQLQINNSGAWKTIAKWDASDDTASAHAHDAVAHLGALEPKATWRIATAERHVVVLKYWNADKGWWVPKGGQV